MAVLLVLIVPVDHLKHGPTRFHVKRMVLINNDLRELVLHDRFGRRTTQLINGRFRLIGSTQSSTLHDRSAKDFAHLTVTQLLADALHVLVVELGRRGEAL